MAKRILVAVKDSNHRKAIIEVVTDIASKHDADLHLLHVVPKAEVSEGVPGLNQVEYPNEAPDDAYSHVMASWSLATLRTDLEKRGVERIHWAVVHGDPVEEITRFAKDNAIDMIVMGDHTPGVFEGLISRGVSQKISHLAKCTCLRVKQANS
jgi:nucleotide-binding universal stress UspA family protein